jgi:uncharacterized protein
VQVSKQISITNNHDANQSFMHLIIFAKAPIPGDVKTRMIPALGVEGAAMLHMALVERAITTAKAASQSVELCCAPDTSHSFFVSMAEDFDVALTAQGEGDLGTRMLRALTRALETHDAAAIVGADCPSVTKQDVKQAFAALATHDTALIPADDGGYVLIAAKRTTRAMFDNIDWGTSSVLAQQRTAFTKASLTWTELETRWDVDRPEDLARLKTLKPSFEFFY